MRSYQIGEVGFSPDSCELHKDGLVEHLQPQVRNVLMVLVENAGEVVSKETLLEQAWNGRFTSDESLTRCISILRKQLSDRVEKHLIETIPRVGYRLHLDDKPEQGDIFHEHWASKPGLGMPPEHLIRLGISALALLAITGLFLTITV